MVSVPRVRLSSSAVAVGVGGRVVGGVARRRNFIWDSPTTTAAAGVCQRIHPDSFYIPLHQQLQMQLHSHFNHSNPPLIKPLPPMGILPSSSRAYYYPHPRGLPNSENRNTPSQLKITSYSFQNPQSTHPSPLLASCPMATVPPRLPPSPPRAYFNPTPRTVLRPSYHQPQLSQHLPHHLFQRVVHLMT